VARHEEPPPAVERPFDRPAAQEEATPILLPADADQETFETNGAGLLLLTRAVIDLRLHEQAATFAGEGFDDQGLGHGAWLLAAPGGFGSGEGHEARMVAPGLALFAGLDPCKPLSNAALSEAWRGWPGMNAAAAPWLRRLSGTRIIAATNPRLIWIDPDPL